MDNRVFNVNGSGIEMLTKTLELAFVQDGGSNAKAKYFVIDKKKGLILLWYTADSQKKKVSKFLTPLTARAVAPIVMEWLQSDEAKTIELEDWDSNCNHDGSNSQGWRVYCEEWGHIRGENGLSYNGSIVAITPAFMWHGK